MANIRPGRMSSSVPQSFKPQPNRISHRGRLHTDQHYTCDYMLLIALKKKLTQIQRSASHKRISGCSDGISGYSICGRCVKLNRPSVIARYPLCLPSGYYSPLGGITHSVINKGLIWLPCTKKPAPAHDPWLDYTETTGGLWGRNRIAVQDTPATLDICCFGVGPASATLGQHQTSTCPVIF